MKTSFVVLLVALSSYGIKAYDGYNLIFCYSALSGPVLANNKVSVSYSCTVEMRGYPDEGTWVRATFCKVTGGGCLPTTCNILFEDYDTWKYYCTFTVPAYTPPGNYIIDITGEAYPYGGTPFSIVNPKIYPPCPAGWAVQTGPQCDICPKGTYSNGTKCVACPMGTSGDKIGVSACAPCPSGSYGVGGATSCKPAVAGWYAPGGTEISYACTPGTYSLAGAAKCTACPAGKYSPCSSASSCTNCSIGRVANSTGNHICIPCPPGTYAPTTGGTECIPCGPNSYSAVLASATCKACPAGTTTSGNCHFSDLCCV